MIDFTLSFKWKYIVREKVSEAICKTWLSRVSWLTGGRACGGGVRGGEGGGEGGEGGGGGGDAGGGGGRSR